MVIGEVTMYQALKGQEKNWVTRPYFKNIKEKLMNLDISLIQEDYIFKINYKKSII